jgi:hypothetical protein
LDKKEIKRNMKKAIRLFLLFVLAQPCMHAIAQNERPVFTLKLRNGDAITGVADISSIALKTSYGDLAFPIKEVSAITLGINTFGVDKTQVMDYLNTIQNGALNDAAIAFDRVIRMEIGAIPYVKEYMESPAYKKKEGSDVSVELAYDVMLSRHNLTKAFRTKDVLQTNGATAIEGSYEFESLALETDYGRISVNRSKISSISVIFKEVNNANTGNFKLYANQNIAGNTNGGWANTGILVRKDQSIRMTASGQVNIASLSNNAYTPDGGVNGTPGPKSGEPSYGCLVYKIGEAGQMMKAGDNYSGKANGTGIIYVSIFESVFNAANTGSYAVKVTVN